MKDCYPYYLANEPVAANADLEVLNKYTQETAFNVALADEGAVDAAITGAVTAYDEFRRWPAYRRREVIEHLREGVAKRRDELADVLVVEVGKPVTAARGEVDRCLDTLSLSVEESTRLTGEWMPLDVSPRGEGYQAIWKRVPVGPCSFILPFNFPLNLAAHKIGPALAVGCPFVMKPDPRTPVCELILGEILAETDLPTGTFSILPVVDDGIEKFSEDERLKLLSFTGSPQVGWMLKSKAGRKRVALELGGNAACVVEQDAPLDLAIERLAAGAFGQAGQSCISVQRILVHKEVFGEVRDRLVETARSLKIGDPADEDTVIGPIISEEHAQRIESWVSDAVKRGAKALSGGRRDGVFYEATVLEHVPYDAKVSCREVFGPVATIESFDDFGEALHIVNDSEYGLQAGVFTRDIHRAFRAFDELAVGGVIINDIPSMRVDAMPYGGVKKSGLGREGVRFAIEDMTERRLMVLNRQGDHV